MEAQGCAVKLGQRQAGPPSEIICLDYMPWWAVATTPAKSDFRRLQTSYRAGVVASTFTNIESGPWKPSTA